MGNLVKSTIIYGFGSVITKSINIILLPFFTRYLTPEEYGVIGILMMFSAFLNALISLGFGTSIGLVYFEKQGYEERLKVIQTAFWTLFLIGFIFIGISFPFSKIFSSLLMGTKKFSLEVMLVILGTVISTLSTPLILNIQFQQKPTVFVAGNLILLLGGMFINFYNVIILRKGLLGYMEAYLIMQLLSLLVFLAFNKFKINLSFDRQIFSLLLKYGLPMIPSFFSLFVLAQGNRYILRFLTDLPTVGLFTVGYNIGTVTQLIVSSFQNAWTPYFLSFYNRQDEAYYHFGQIMKYYILMMGFLCLCFFIFSKFVVIAFIAKNFYESYKIIGPVALSNLFIGLFSLLLPPMYFEKEVKYVSLFQGIAAIVSIPLNILLIGYLKHVGAAIALCIGYFIMCILTMFFNRYKSKSKLKNYYRENDLVKIIIILIIFAILSYAPRKFELLGELIFSTTICILLVIITLLILKKEDKDRLKRLFLHLGCLRS